MRRIFVFLVFFLFAAAVNGQNVPQGFDLSNYGVRVEPDKRLIVVLATLEMATTKNAAGVDERLLNIQLGENGAKFRDRLMLDNASLPDDLRRKITGFVAQYKRSHPKATDADLVAPFISMAYTLTPVPELADPVVTNDLPGSLLDVLDFAPLAREFYRRSTIGAKLDDYVKEYRADSDETLRNSTREMVSEILDYLHTRPKLTFAEKVKVETKKANSKSGSIQKIETREHERHFYVVPEKLAAKGNINFLNIRDDYYVIVPPDTDLSFSGARRAFLQFVIDPLILNYSREMVKIGDWAKPVLDERRKADASVSPDVFLSVSRSLVAAADVRQSEYLRLQIATDQARRKVDQMAKDDPSNTTGQSQASQVETLGCKQGNNKANIICKKWAVYDDLEKYKQALSDESDFERRATCACSRLGCAL